MQLTVSFLVYFFYAALEQVLGATKLFKSRNQSADTPLKLEVTLVVFVRDSSSTFLIFFFKTVEINQIKNSNFISHDHHTFCEFK